MKSSIISLITIALSVSWTSARIGETHEQLVKRYGPLIEDSGGLLVFKKNGYDVAARILNGKCQFLMISGVKKASGANADPFTPEQTRLFLESSGGKGNWTGDGGIYKTTNGEITAVLVSDSCLLLQTKAYKEARSKKQEAELDATQKEASGLDGF